MTDSSNNSTRRKAGDLVRLTGERGWNATPGAIGRIRGGDIPEVSVGCPHECPEWPNVDYADGTQAYHVPECSMEDAP